MPYVRGGKFHHKEIQHLTRMMTYLLCPITTSMTTQAILSIIVIVGYSKSNSKTPRFQRNMKLQFNEALYIIILARKYYLEKFGCYIAII